MNTNVLQRGKTLFYTGYCNNVYNKYYEHLPSTAACMYENLSADELSLLYEDISMNVFHLGLHRPSF